MSDLVSIVVPCHNEEESIPLLLHELGKVSHEMDGTRFELIFVDDGSLDGTLKLLRELSKKDFGEIDIRYISLSRNFGKEAAMLAGLEASTGDFVAVMDADMQHPPDLLPIMYRGIACEGFDSVAARRICRKGESRLRSWLAGKFYRIINHLSSTQMVDGATDYRLMTRQMVDAVLSLREYNRFTKGLFSWVGFSVKWLDYENIPRNAGRTKWSFWQLFTYSLDGIVAFSVKPLAISSLLGVIFCILAFLYAIFIAVRWLLFGDPVQGWATLMCVILFASGIQLFCTGILGQYIAKSYLEAKGRPIYIVKEKNTSSKGSL